MCRCPSKRSETQGVAHSAPHHVRTQGESSSSANRRLTSPEAGPTCTWTLNFQPGELWEESACCVSLPVWGTCHHSLYSDSADGRATRGPASSPPSRYVQSGETRKGIADGFLCVFHVRLGVCARCWGQRGATNSGLESAESLLGAVGALLQKSTCGPRTWPPLAGLSQTPGVPPGPPAPAPPGLKGVSFHVILVHSSPHSRNGASA